MHGTFLSSRGMAFPAAATNDLTGLGEHSVNTGNAPPVSGSQQRSLSLVRNCAGGRVMAGFEGSKGSVDDL